jgi:phosphoribosyl 1,2-cyclic phosphate phosphodiesterase
LIDTATEFRLQALKNQIPRVDLVLITHHHADHVSGFDDLRRFNQLQGGPIPVYGRSESLTGIATMFPYIFDDTVQVGGGKPQVQLLPVNHGFEAMGVTITPIPIFHGRLSIYGYRIGRFAYLTDCSRIPEESLALLEGLDLLVLGVLRFRAHPTHFNLEEGLRVVERLKPGRCLFTHISHDFKHSDMTHYLPEGVELGYDGEQIEMR